MKKVGLEIGCPSEMSGRDFQHKDFSVAAKVLLMLNSTVIMSVPPSSLFQRCFICNFYLITGNNLPD